MPELTVTDVGTTAAPILLFRRIFKPVVGAGPLIVTVPATFSPPTAEVGLIVTDVSSGGVMVKFAVSTTLFSVAEMVAVFWDVTDMVFTTKVTEVLPEGTVVVAPTTADEELLDSLTTRPLEGAGLETVIVPLEATVPATVVGASVNPIIVGGLTVIVPVADTNPFLPVMVTTDFEETAVVLTRKVTEV